MERREPKPSVRGGGSVRKSKELEGAQLKMAVWLELTASALNAVRGVLPEEQVAALGYQVLVRPPLEILLRGMESILEKDMGVTSEGSWEKVYKELWTQSVLETTKFAGTH